MNDPSNLTAQELIKRFGPRRPPRFAALMPHRDLIAQLRGLKASYLTIFQALQFKGVAASESAVRKFCLEVLEGVPRRHLRKRRGNPKESIASQALTTPPSARSVPSPNPSQTLPNSGPRVAKVEFLEPPTL